MFPLYTVTAVITDNGLVGLSSASQNICFIMYCQLPIFSEMEFKHQQQQLANSGLNFQKPLFRVLQCLNVMSDRRLSAVAFVRPYFKSKYRDIRRRPCALIWHSCALRRCLWRLYCFIKNNECIHTVETMNLPRIRSN